MHSIRIIGSTFASSLLLSTSIASAQQVSHGKPAMRNGRREPRRSARRRSTS